MIYPCFHTILYSLFYSVQRYRCLQKTEKNEAVKTASFLFAVDQQIWPDLTDRCACRDKQL